MITIYGASDDLVEVDGCVGADEFNVGVNWQGDLVAPGTEQLRVFAEYDAARNGCWLIAVTQTDEDVPLPSWPITFSGHDSGYSLLLSIDAPAGTRLTNIFPPPRVSS